MFVKKITLLIILLSTFLLPTVILAQTEPNASITTACWDSKTCEQTNGVWEAGGTYPVWDNEKRRYVDTPCPTGQGFCYGKNEKPINLQVKLPTDSGLQGTVNSFAEYLGIFYKFFVAMIAVMAVVMIMWGGFKLIYRGGSAPAVTDAKETIFGAVAALVIALLSYNLLSLVNPDLVKFDDLRLPLIKTQTFGNWCPATDGNGNLTNIQCGDDTKKHPNTGQSCMGQYCDATNGICIYKSDVDAKPQCVKALASGKINWEANAYLDYMWLGTVCSNDTYQRLDSDVFAGRAGNVNTLESDTVEQASSYFIGLFKNNSDLDAAGRAACGGGIPRGYLIEVEINDDGDGPTIDDNYVIGRDCRPISILEPDEIDWEKVSPFKFFYLPEFPIASPGIEIRHCSGVIGNICNSDADCGGGTCGPYMPAVSCDININRAWYPDR